MKTQVKWILLIGLVLCLFGVNANSQELPKTKNDWRNFDSYKFSGNSFGFTYMGNIYFKRNGVEVDIKEDTVVFMNNAYFKTNSSIVKLEQGKLIISTTEEIARLTYHADKIEEKENKLHLIGDAFLNFPSKSTFRANEIIIERKDSN